MENYWRWTDAKRGRGKEKQRVLTLKNAGKSLSQLHHTELDTSNTTASKEVSSSNEAMFFTCSFAYLSSFLSCCSQHEV